MTRFMLRLLIVGCIAIVPVAGVAIGAEYALGVTGGIPAAILGSVIGYVGMKLVIDHFYDWIDA